MNRPRLFSLCLLGAALTLSACGKDEDSDGSAAAMSSSSGDRDETGDTASTGAITTGGDPMSASQCDPWLQDCPDGQKCVAYASMDEIWDANKCVPVMGDGQIGDSCKYDGVVMSTDDCGAGSWCWNVDADGVGVCTGFCGGAPESPVCDTGFGCWIANESAINMCLLQCDPLAQDCPGSEDWCFYNYMSGNFTCKARTEDLPTGASCTAIDACVGGNTCLQAEVFPTCAGFACCAAFCDLNSPTCAQAGTQCVSLFGENGLPQYDNLGVCIVGW